MGSLDRRIRQLEELYRTSPSEASAEDLAQRKAAFIATMKRAREKAEREEAEGDPGRRMALDELEEHLGRRVEERGARRGA